jgi:hypothetical protein
MSIDYLLCSDGSICHHVNGNMEGIFSGFKFSASLASFQIQYGILLCLELSTITFFQFSTLDRNHHRGINRLRIPIDISKRLGRS